LGSPASATPAADGRRVYVYFSAFGLLAYDFEGRERWRRPLPVPNFATGTGTSPIVLGRRVVLNCDQDGGPSFLLDADSRDGHQEWRSEGGACGTARMGLDHIGIGRPQNSPESRHCS